MHIVSGKPNSLPTGLYDQLASYRYQVFVEHLGWELDTPPGHEADQFDRPDTVYVVAKTDTEELTGCARLLPTTQPYLLGDVFPQLLQGQEIPCDPEVWELSRFAAVDFSGHNGPGSGQFSSPVAIRLMQEAVACAARHGAKRLITVSPIGVERLLRRAGFHARRAGPPMIVGGHPLFACWIETQPLPDINQACLASSPLTH